MNDTEPLTVNEVEAARKAAAAAKKAPAAKKVAADKAPRGPGRPSNLDKLEASLTDLFSTVGVFVGMADPFDGQVIVAGAPNLAGALTAVAKENPKVAKSLARITETSAWGGVVFAVAGIAVPIAAHHGLLPAGPMTTLLTDSKVPEDTAA